MSFLDVHDVPAEHGYEFRNGWLGTSETAQSAKTIYSFSTSAHAGLGDQLPAGVLRFYLRDKRGDPASMIASLVKKPENGECR